MQAPLKDLISSLHSDYFKINGFKKKAVRFSRVVDGVIQEVDFRSSQWNSKGEPIVFYVNLRISFVNIPLKNGYSLSGEGRIGKLVLGAPDHFELTDQNEQVLHDELISYFPRALHELPSHYEDVRRRALRGFCTPIPLPDTWRTEEN